MAQFGGSAIFLSPRDTQLGRGEPIEDSARVISRMCDAVMIRTFAHATIERFAQYSKVPVINALTDDHHPASYSPTCKPSWNIAAPWLAARLRGLVMATICATAMCMLRISLAFS